MAVAYITAPAVVANDSGVNNLQSGAFTPTGADALFAFCLTYGGTPTTHTGAKWGGSGGDAMTQIGATQSPSTHVRLSAWQKAAPVIASRTLYASLGATQDGIAVTGAAFSGVDQTTPGTGLVSSGGTVSNSGGFDATVTVPTAAGDTVLAAFFVWDNNGSSPLMTPNGTPSPTDRVSLDAFDTIIGVQLTTIVATGTSTVASCNIAPTSSNISGEWGAIAFVVKSGSTGTAISGTGAASASGSGSLTTRAPLIGTGKASSSALGVLNGGATLIGTGRATAASQADLAVPYVSPTLLGNPSAWWLKARFAMQDQAAVAIFGTGREVASSTAVLSVQAALSGTGAAATSASGSLTARDALSGVGSASASGQGTITSFAALAGSGLAPSGGAGALSVRSALAGSAAGAAAGAGVLTVASALAGTGAARSSASGLLNSGLLLSGSGISQAFGLASITVRAVLSGSGGANTSGAGTLSGAPALSGTGLCVTSGVGALTARVSLAGSGASFSAGAGDLAPTAAALSGTGAARSTSSANLGQAGATLAGYGSSYASGVAALDPSRAALQAIANAKSSSSAALSVIGAMTGCGKASASGCGILTKAIQSRPRPPKHRRFVFLKTG